ncbi:hypothetical protein PPL_06552 [Heterostelium album PN500]|uniref:Laminin G domain-containing protein n=1 Tax=Heterostelium pallidum (strain ATCC 26659 / Pp 5 / PN500) TaxID=670386 RepID=D3BDG9_HETP5|nr:hypothetical protein PPL_06552 [Heterostelium album PN500]EFA80613.1 hypothetical protein PPL_06552 [Heterostelium album PN500]|eukprot:XP_020432733.1 hypothetical protein PPL_06552 [Heterostelium album PN500]
MSCFLLVYHFMNAIVAAVTIAAPELLPGFPPPLAGAIVNSLFPNQASDPQAVWNSILVYAQAAIDKSIDTATYSLVQSELLGFSQLMDEYYFAAMSDPDSTPEYLSSVYISCVTQVIRQEQLFKTEQFQATLLPLFAQFANLYLTFIRDGVNYGNQLGWSQSVKAKYDTLMKSKITSYASYANSVINTRIQSLPYTVSTLQPVDQWNKISDELNHFYMSVTLFSYNWKYFDVKLYPTGGSIGPVSHILLSNLAGVFNIPDCTYNVCKKLNRPETVASQVSTTRMMSKITPYFHTGLSLVGLNIEYNDGSTKLIGRSSGSNISPDPTLVLRKVPIVSVSISTDPIHTHAITFTYFDSTKDTLGKVTTNSKAQTFDSSFPGQCVVDIVEPGYDLEAFSYLSGLAIAYDDVDFRFPVSSSGPVAVSQYYYQESNGESRYLYNSPGKVSTDLAAFIGPTSQINIPNKGVYDFGTNDFSATSLVQTTVPGTIMSNKPEPGSSFDNGGWRIVINENGLIIFIIDNGFGSYKTISSTTQILDGNWHHVAAIRRSGSLEIWLDAVKLTTTTSGSNLSAKSTNTLLIGANYYTNQPNEPHFVGSIEDITIWNVAISQTQISNTMYKNIVGNEPNLVGYWPFDNNFNDKSSTGNNGASTGTINFVPSTLSSNIGWSFGGYSFKAFQVPWSVIIDPTTASDTEREIVYRFKFTQSNGNRFYYTTDSSFTSSGWVKDGIAFQVYDAIDATPSAKPVYRYSRTQIQAFGSGLVYGYSTVPNMLGWTKEGIAWYTTSDSTPSFLSYQDLEYKMIQNVGSQSCLTAPTTSGSSVTLSTCDQSNLQQFWYLKYDSFGPHLYNPKTMMYMNSQTTTLIGTTSIPQNNFNILNQLTNGQYIIQEYISSLCLQLNTVSNIVEFKTCDSSNQNQIWKYPSSVLVESSKSIPLFPGACLDSLGLKCPTTLPEGKTLKTSTTSLTINSQGNGYLSLKSGGSEVFSLGVTTSTSGPYSITIQSFDGNVVLVGKSGTFTAIMCNGLEGQYLNLLDSIYGLPYGLVVQNAKNKMVWSKLGYPTSMKIGLIPGSFIDNLDTNNYLGVNQFITNGRDYLIVKKTPSGDSFGAYLYGQNPNAVSTPLWKYEYSTLLKEDLRMYVHYNGDTNTFCFVNSITGSYSCHMFGDWNTPSIQSSRYLQIPAPGSDQATDWAIALRSATGSLTYGYFGNSKAFGNFALQPNTNTLYQNRFLSFQINQNKYYIKNLFTNQILQESPANLQICNHAWSSTGIYQLIYDTTTTCSSNAKTMIDSSGVPNDRSTQTGRSIILLPSMPELVVSDRYLSISSTSIK